MKQVLGTIDGWALLLPGFFLPWAEISRRNAGSFPKEQSEPRMRPCSMGPLEKGRRVGVLRPDLCWGPANLLGRPFWDSGCPLPEVEPPLTSTEGPSSASLGRRAGRSRRQPDGAHWLLMSWPRPLFPTPFLCWGQEVTLSTGGVFPLQQEEEERGGGSCRPLQAPPPNIYSLITSPAYKIPK